MPKQIKIGFDKTPPRSTSIDQILVDVKGFKLRDESGNFLYTPSFGIPESFLSARNATSIYINNAPSVETGLGKAISIIEEFPSASAVSSTLLGVPRLEKQQSLLSDVSVYGINDDIWEFYKSPSPFQPIEWSRRNNPVYGNRFNPVIMENANQQSLSIEAFPVPWTFPFGPDWKSRHNPVQFALYANFIRLGNLLYDVYLNDFPEFAKNNFVPLSMAQVTGTGDGTDVVYNANFTLSMSVIEKWTLAWMDIRDGGKMLNPSGTNDQPFLNATTVNLLYLFAENYDFNLTTPGYSSTMYNYCQLQSKEAFRYQPGAASGFTFGIRLQPDENSFSNVLEWGCANDTDQYMFQVTGTAFNIVRRSTVPLTEGSLIATGVEDLEKQSVEPVPNPFERADSTRLVSNDDTQEIQDVYEMIYTQDDFNGDALDGTGPSEYNISLTSLTMFKIEYSWYGAIGAKFYAYVPVGNEEARWILIHTIVIENTLDSPSLKNPIMRFRYSLYLTDTSSLRAPVYLHKYGASYLIDGVDEGAFTFNSFSTNSDKNIIRVNSSPLIGFIPKNVLFNSDGIPITNQRNFYIDKISVSSDRDARIDILECEGCTNGFGQYYAPGLENGTTATVDQYILTSTNEILFSDTDKIFTPADNNKKIITDGIYSSYGFYPEGAGSESEFLVLNRRLGTDPINVPIDNEGYQATRVRRNNEIITLPPTSSNPFEFTGRLTGFNDVVASTIPITKKKFRVHYLNPVAKESTGHFAEFVIGVVDKPPEIEEGALVFNGQSLVIDNELHVEFTQYQQSQDVQGIENSEQDPRYGFTGSGDPRLNIPGGVDSGTCSTISFDIEQITYQDVVYSDTNPISSESGEYLIFQSNIGSVMGGDIGVFNGNIYVFSGSKFLTNLVSYIDQFDNIRYYAVIEPITLAGFDENSLDSISLKNITATGRFINKSQAIPFNSNLFYIFIAMRDNAKINNIVIEESDNVGNYSHIPQWIGQDFCNISVTNPGGEQPDLDDNITDYITNTNEYINLDGEFVMGGFANSSKLPSNFNQKERLSSVKFDTQLTLPLRPSSIKGTFYLSANKTTTIDMKHIFGIDRFKATTGSLNNKSIYISAKTSDPADNVTGKIKISVAGKEQ
jgi:hypothetical protein